MARNVDRLGRSLKDPLAFLSEADTFASRSLDLPSVNSLSHARVRQLPFGHLDRVPCRSRAAVQFWPQLLARHASNPLNVENALIRHPVSIAILWRDPSQGRGRALGRRP